MEQRKLKRKKIIETSIRLFIKNGFHGTPTSLIAKESGVANGTLFNYFKTKDVLINEVFKEVKMEQKLFIIKGLSEELKLKEKLKRIWENIIIWGIENPDKRKFLEYISNSYYISDITKAKVKKNYKFLFEIFEEIIEKKQLKNTTSLMLILNFIGKCIFTGKYFHITKSKYDRDLVMESFERFCKGLEITEED
jgi:AcrR family transcriptional regulator